MANESVSFDFASRGAASLQNDFRKTGDSAALAAKGARILADSLEKQRKAAAASAGATLAQARADKILADAEDDAIAKSVEERIATERAAAAKRKDAEAARLDAEATKKAAEQHKSLTAALGRLGRLGGGAGLLGLGAAGASLAGPLGAAAAAVGAFGAVAIPELTKIQAALAKTGKARKTAFAALTAPEKQLAGDVQNLKNTFHGFESSLAPVIDSLVKFGGGLLKDALPAIGGLARTGATVIRAFLGPLDTFVKSKTFASLATQLSALAVQAAQILGPQLAQLLKVFLQLFVQVGPSGIQLMKALFPVITDVVQATAPLITLTAELVAHFITFLNQKHLLLPFLGALAAAFLVLSAESGILAVTLAIGVLVTAITYLVKHWSQVWAGIKSVAHDAWSFIHDGWGKYLFPGIYLIGVAVEKLRDHWRGAWQFMRDLLATVVDRILGLFGTIIHGAANAFGWVPGIGSKLRGAADAFDRFRARVNNALHGISGRTVDVGVNFSLGVPGHRLSAAGGPIYGPGTATSDSIPAMLSNGEYVVKAASVAKYGTRMMDTINAGRFAAGGPVGFGVNPVLPSSAQISANILPTLRSLATEFAKTAITAIGRPAGHGGFGGGVARWAPTALRVLGMLGQPSGDLGTVLSQMQTESGGNPYVVNKWDSNWARGTPSVGLMQVIGPTFAANAGPFRGVGPFEYGVSVNPLANIYAGLNYAIRRYGAAWTRVLGQGHGYDSGGYLPQGLSLAYNGTGRPEMVVPQGRGGGAATVILEVRSGGAPADALVAEMIRRYVRVRGGNVQAVFGRT